MDRKKLTEGLGLDVTATDEEIFAKIGTLMTAATTAEAATTEAVEMKDKVETITNSLTTATGRITTLEGELKASREVLANSRLDSAVETGRITQAERSEWLPKLTGDNLEAETNALTALKPALNMKSLDVSGSRIQIGDAAERRETISNAVDAQMSRGLSYDEAYAAAKKDPKLKPVWEAMNVER